MYMWDENKRSASESRVEGYNLPEMGVDRASNIIRAAFHEAKTGEHVSLGPKFSDAECAFFCTAAQLFREALGK